MINVAVIDTNGKSRMFLRNTLTHSDSIVRSFADVFYYSAFAKRRKINFDVLVYNISEVFNRDSYKSIVHLMDSSKAPVIVVSKKNDVRLLRALNNMGVERYIHNKSDSDLRVRLSVALEKTTKRIRANRRKLWLTKLKFFMYTYSAFVVAVLTTLIILGHKNITPEDATKEGDILYFRGDSPRIVLELSDTLMRVVELDDINGTIK